LNLKHPRENFTWINLKKKELYYIVNKHYI
jgi:hypothetical protein